MTAPAPSPGAVPAATPKSVQTRAKVLDAALGMLREQGYEATTMRAIATRAGVSTGNAYYYFPSKDHLVQELYVDVQRSHRRAVDDALGQGGTLAERLRLVLDAGIDVFTPYHSFAAEFVSVAIRPGAAANPFSDASREARELSLAIFEDVVAGASPAVPAALRAQLPELLWLANLGVTLFWVQDSSSGTVRTRRLVAGASPIVGTLVRLSRLPVARKVVDDVLRLTASLRT